MFIPSKTFKVKKYLNRQVAFKSGPLELLKYQILKKLGAAANKIPTCINDFGSRPQKTPFESEAI